MRTTSWHLICSRCTPIKFHWQRSLWHITWYHTKESRTDSSIHKFQDSQSRTLRVKGSGPNPTWLLVLQGIQGCCLDEIESYLLRITTYGSCSFLITILGRIKVGLKSLQNPMSQKSFKKFTKVTGAWNLAIIFNCHRVFHLRHRCYPFKFSHFRICTLLQIWVKDVSQG